MGAEDANGYVELRTTLTSNSLPTKVDVVLSGMTLEKVRLLNAQGGEVRLSANAEKYTLIVTGKDALAAAKVVSVAVTTVDGFGGTKTVDKPVNEMPDSSHGGGSGGGGCDAGVGGLALALVGAFLLLSRRPPSTGR